MSAAAMHNFSAGPGALPRRVVEACRDAIENVPEVGLSVLGISHRSDWFRAVVTEVEDNVRRLLGLSSDQRVILLQGGGSLQFTMVPMLLLRGRAAPAEYLTTGYWSEKALAEARREGPVRVLWDGRGHGFRRLPQAGELEPSPGASYLHYVSNETVEGLQFAEPPGLDTVPRVADMSSDFLSRPIPAHRFDLIYAHSQKNLGPAGVTLVIIREGLLERAQPDIPAILDYRVHVEKRSIYNTPPVFAIFAVRELTRWLLEDIGGLAAMEAINRRKAEILYALMEKSDGYYRPRAHPPDRSMMNVVFELADPTLEVRFLTEAARAGFAGLPGHRTLGGVRASLYNGVSLEAVEALAAFMEDFRAQNPRASAGGTDRP